MVGYDSAILVDAERTGSHLPGSVTRRTLDSLTGMQTLEREGEHGLSWVIETWRQAGWKMPHHVDVWAIEVRDVDTRGHDLTAPVDRAAVRTMLEIYRVLQDGEGFVLSQAA